MREREPVPVPTGTLPTLPPYLSSEPFPLRRVHREGLLRAAHVLPRGVELRLPKADVHATVRSSGFEDALALIPRDETALREIRMHAALAPPP